MANQAPPIQGYMLEVAATRLTPEKLALLNYKLATGSPTAAQIMACIKPGEWESATGDTREFNDIRCRLEAAIDAWVKSNPTSKGFVWPTAKADYLNLSRAAHMLAQMTNDPNATDDAQAIIEAGAQCQIPIYWRNSAQIWTRLSDFKGDLKGTDSASRYMQLHPQDVAKFETAQQVDVLSFELTDQDIALLQHSQPKEPPGTGGEVFIGEPGYRHVIDHQPVTITWDQLRVNTADLQAYAAPLTPATVPAAPPAPKAAVVDQVQVQVIPNACVVTTHSTKAKELDHIGQHLKEIVSHLAHPTVDTVMVEFKELALAGVPPFTGGISTDESNKKQPKGSLLYVKGADVIGLKRRDIRERLDRLNGKNSTAY